MTATTVWAAMDGLKAALDASAELTAVGCPVAMGFPRQGPQRPRQIWIPAEVDDLDTIAEISGQSGVGAFEETYQLRVYAVATVPASGTFAEWRDRLEELVDPIIAAVRADQQLGGAVHLATPGRVAMGESLSSETDRHLDAVIWIRVQAFVCP